MAAQSAVDAAFASLTVGVHFTRSRFEQQRQLFEDTTPVNAGRHNGKSAAGIRAAPVVAGVSGRGGHDADGTSSTIHALLASLPPPRLDFLTRAPLDHAQQSQSAGNPSAAAAPGAKAGRNAGADGNGDANEDDADAAASKRVALKPAGRKQIGNFLTKHNVEVKGTNFEHASAVPINHLLLHFGELVRPPLNVSQTVVDRLFDRQLTRPTTIQSLTIPLLLAHRNVIGCAPTGSGKTIAFLVPMFALLQHPAPSSPGVRALIVAPTKELAAQIEREAHFLMKGAPWRVVRCGHHDQRTPQQEQQQQQQQNIKSGGGASAPTTESKGRDVFITTPARAVSMAESGEVSLRHVRYLVFDEGDKLWDSKSDFGDQVRRIVAFVNEGRSSADVKNDNTNNNEVDGGDVDDGGHATAAKAGEQTKPQKRASDLVIAFFSATLPPKAERLARAFMPDAVLLVVVGRQSANVACDQKLVFAGNELGKITIIRNMLVEGGMRPPVLIFVQSIERSMELYDEIRANGLHVAVLNANLSSEVRDRIVQQFRVGDIWVLITTELLARGVDFKGVATVINFDLPLTAESYIHRVGRTGRAGNRGNAVTFFTEADKLRLPPIVKIVHESGSPVAPYLLELKAPTPRQLRQLERSVPQRLAVSTRKRMRIGEERIMRQANKYCRAEGDDDEDNDGDEDGGGFGDADDDDAAGRKSGKKPRAGAKPRSKKRVPNESAAFEDDEV